MANAKLTLIQIQEHYIDRLNDARRRWAHRKDGGHSLRTGRGARREARGARQEAEARLAKWGITGKVARQIIWDAHDMAELMWLVERQEG